MELNCWECGNVIEVDIKRAWIDSKGFYNREQLYPPKQPWKRFYCGECEDDVKQRFDNEKQEYITLKIKMLFERAIGILENQKMPLYEYEEAIKAVREFALESPDKFDSSYEMIAAIILINSRIETKLQYKIGRYKVDFYLPTLKTILEIDGERHKDKGLYDSNRDIKIRQALGLDWEVVRIPTKYLEENARVLPTAIVELKKLKQETRIKNHGILPAHFSKRDKAKAEEVARIAGEEIEKIEI